MIPAPSDNPMICPIIMAMMYFIRNGTFSRQINPHMNRIGSFLSSQSKEDEEKRTRR
jgi:hypothetical protein